MASVKREAASTTNLSCGPAQQQRIATSLAVEVKALCFAGLRKCGITLGELCERGKRGFFAEFFEDQFLRGRTDALPRGENGLAARR